MGNKCHASSKEVTKLKTYVISQKPMSLKAQLDPNNKPQPLKFIVEIDKIKCKNLTQTDCFVEFNFAGQKQFSTIIIANDKNPRWKNKEKFEYHTDTVTIKSSYLTIHIKNNIDKKLSILSLCLYDVATGPIYHDLSLESKGASVKGRLAFNLKMRQRVKILIEPIKIQCDLTELLKETSYNFNFRFISADGSDILHTEHSDVIVNNFSLMGALEKEREYSQSIDEDYNKEDFTYEMMNEGEKRLKHFHTSRGELKEGTRVFSKLKSFENLSNVILKKASSNVNFRKNEKSEKELREQPQPEAPINKHEIIWDFVKESFTMKPLVEVEIGSNDFSQSCMQFFLWAPKMDDPTASNFHIKKEEKIHDQDELLKEDEKEKESEQVQVVNNKLIGECYININKLFKDDIRAFDADKNIDFVLTNKEKVINEKLWNHGVLVGHLKGLLKVINDPFIKQIMLGVRTEQGIRISSSVFYRDDKEEAKNSLQKEISEMIAAKELLIQSMIQLFDRRSQESPDANQEKLNEKIMQQIDKISSIAKISKKETLNTFLYHNKVELMRTQLMMIDLADHLLSYADEGNEKIRNSYYLTLKLIMNRGELDIAQMRFDETYNFLLDPASQAKKRQFDKKVLLKMDVSLSFQQFLYKALDKVLYKLNQKGGEKAERDFIDNFCAIAYFKIPEFRVKLLECIKQVNVVEINEWRGTEWKLDDAITDDQRDLYLVKLFNWENAFYKFLKTDPREEKNAKKLKEILDKDDWQKRFQKRGIAFFNFLGDWVHYIKKKVVVEENFNWQDIKGYRVLLKAMFTELKIRPISAFSDALISASKKMLLNEKLLNTYVAIIYKRTKVFDSNNVSLAFDMISEWMSWLAKEKKKIPNSFDYDFFFEGIRKVFELDHSFSIGKALSLLYKNFILFHLEFQKEVCDYLFTQIFFKLFMHWSWNVRLVFHHFLLYRIYHLHRNMKTAVSKLDDLKMELMAYNHKRKKNAKNTMTKEQLINDLINMEYSKMMTIIENAKMKLEKEEDIKAATDFFLAPTENTSRGVTLRQKLRERQEKQYKQRAKNQDTPNKKIEPLIKKSAVGFNPMKDSSVLLINSSSFEIDSQAIKERSVSMVLKEHESSDSETPWNREKQEFSQHSFMGLTPSEKDLMGPSQNVTGEKKPDSFEEEEEKNMDANNNVERIDRSKKMSINRRNTIGMASTSNLKKGEKIVVNKRFVYWDEHGGDYIQLPEDGMKYLRTAYVEYEALKKKYVKWYTKNKHEFSHLNKEEFAQKMKDMPVPEVVVRMFMDENELEVEKDNEW